MGSTRPETRAVGAALAQSPDEPIAARGDSFTDTDRSRPCTPVGLRAGMLLLYATLGYILSIGFWARPIVDNATVSLRELAVSMRQAVARRGTRASSTS